MENAKAVHWWVVSAPGSAMEFGTALCGKRVSHLYATNSAWPNYGARRVNCKQCLAFAKVVMTHLEGVR